MEATRNITKIGDHLPKASIADFSHIELTPEEERNALNYFRMLKSRQLDEEEEKRQRLLIKQKAQEPWTTEQLKADVLSRAAQLPFKFQIDKNNEHVFMLLCLYFSNNKEFEQFGIEDKSGKIVVPYSLKKGIALVSQTKGTGKNTFMDLFSRNKRQPFIGIETETIATQYAKKGEDTILLYSNTLPVSQTPSLFYFSKLGICFNDVGREVNKNHYGPAANVMSQLFFKLNTNGKNTHDWSGFHLTSNFIGDEFEKRYDDAIRSRMREMFNFIELTGPDRRK